jgi:hypothetical protein
MRPVSGARAASAAGSSCRGTIRRGRACPLLNRRSHAAIATLRANDFGGVSQLSVCRGRPFNSAATRSSCRCVCPDKSVPLGKYWRMRPLLFSLLARSQGLRGSQKYILTPVSTVKRRCSPISLPRSQVSERSRNSGRLPNFLARATLTSSANRPSGRRQRDCSHHARGFSAPGADPRD